MEDNCNASNTTVATTSSERKPIVLGEDEYLERMAYIIKRDFYSDKSCHGSLDTRLRPGYRTISTRRDICSDVGTTSRRYQFYSPTTTDASNRIEEPGLPFEEDASLDQFLSTHNSEDNILYEDIKRRERISHRLKHPWLYARSNIDQTNDQMILPSIEEQSSIGSEGKMIDVIAWPKRDLSIQQDTMEHGNGFNRCSTINHSATKIIKDYSFRKPDEQPADTLYSQNAAALLAQKVGIDGRLMKSGETPRIGGYSFIPLTPKIDQVETPIDLHMITSTSTPQYKVPSTPDREILAHTLADKAAKSKRTMSYKYHHGIKQSPYSMRTTDGKLSSLSPAARHLSASLLIKRPK